MPIIKYVTTNIVESLDRATNDQFEPTSKTLSFTVSSDDLAAIVVNKNNAIHKFMVEKVQPAYFGGESVSCVSCQSRPAVRMVNTLSMHPNSPEGPVICDHTPFPICQSPDCNARATREAHEYRKAASGDIPALAETEYEICVNCKITKKANDRDGRMKRCSQCKATLYCSRSCQREHWRKGHKLICKSANV